MEDLIESSSVTPSTAPHSRSLPIREDCWSEEATSTLVDAWGRRYLELNRGNLRQKDWQDVADTVNALHGHTKKTHRTDVQCKNRIDTIKKKYKIEKSRVVSSNGTLTSSWPFFERLDSLIGSNFNSSIKKPPSPSLSPSPPVALPLHPSYRRTPPVSSTPPPQPAALAVALPQKRTLPVDDGGYFRRNYSAMAAAAAAQESDRIKRLARAVERFGEVYERVESDKLKQMVDLEKQRMKFAKDLEMERMRIFTETQIQIEKIKKDYNVKQMAMLLGDLLQNSSGKRYGVNCWRILEMGSCSALVRRAQFCFYPPVKISSNLLDAPCCGSLFCLSLSVSKFAAGFVSEVLLSSFCLNTVPMQSDSK
ncbi:hypothetical protein NC653_001301 [Populus alba x Populus x berolinensis]|uniref:Myb/SANT-like DNA-binding domain-containing protein n=1 Tax=Populus alba x Populus x berolinensis TaxID=444605 RepID=A0AAD6RLY9_9ROSI|nr:hypothetical protein NC653_001301 [Populus alba x Populus x berolinensis]